MSKRRSLLGAVHIKAKQLGLDEAARRDLQQRITGHASCKDMTDNQLRFLLAQMDNTGGFSHHTTPVGGKAYHEQKDPRARKVAAMWRQLSQEEVVNSPHASALNSFVQRQVGISALDWVRDNKHFDALIIALRGMAKRHGVALHE